jgi:hypothetical protein
MICSRFGLKRRIGVFLLSLLRPFQFLKALRDRLKILLWLFNNLISCIRESEFQKHEGFHQSGIKVNHIALLFMLKQC